MIPFATPAQWIISLLLILSALGVVLTRKPVHACISFLFALLMLSALYFQLDAQFIGVMQVLVYAGAILVIFMFVIVLFQDAYLQIEKTKGQSDPFFLIASASVFVLTLFFLALRLFGATAAKSAPEDFGTVEALGKALYVDYFFPFEAVILLFLIALIGTLYIGKKEKVT